MAGTTPEGGSGAEWTGLRTVGSGVRERETPGEAQPQTWAAGQMVELFSKLARPGEEQALGWR